MFPYARFGEIISPLLAVRMIECVSETEPRSSFIEYLALQYLE
jgi:hypothetical protein